MASLLRSIWCSARKSVSSSSFSSQRFTYPSRVTTSLFHPRAFYCDEYPRAFSVPTSSGIDTKLRNVAVFGLANHGRTTLIDNLSVAAAAVDGTCHERSMADSIIPSKVTSISWKGYELNMIDVHGQPPDAGDVDLLGMVEGAIYVVDAAEGPKGQTKFALTNALWYGLRPLVILNNVDKPSVSMERCDLVIKVLHHFIANNIISGYQSHFPLLYASATEGWASSTFTKDPPIEARNMSELFDKIVSHVPSPEASSDGPFRMLVSTVENDSHGQILTGRISSGRIHVGDRVHGLRSIDCGGVGKIEEGKVLRLMKNKGTSTAVIESGVAGDFISMATGMTKLSKGSTIAHVEVETALPVPTELALPKARLQDALTAVVDVPPRGDMEEMFKRWMLRYRMRYGTEDEYLHRFQIYKSNFEFINHMNSLSVLCKYRENDVMDLTHEEIRLKRGLKKSTWKCGCAYCSILCRNE